MSDDGNETVSILKYSPSVHENEKSLRCRAENPALLGSVIENFITLEVSCKLRSILMRLILLCLRFSATLAEAWPESGTR